jgi:hypothetical protein
VDFLRRRVFPIDSRFFRSFEQKIARFFLQFFKKKSLWSWNRDLSRFDDFCSQYFQRVCNNKTFYVEDRNNKTFRIFFKRVFIVLCLLNECTLFMNKYMLLRI